MKSYSFAARIAPAVLLASLAHGAVTFNPGSGCVANGTDASGNSGVKCFGSDGGSGIVQFTGTGSGTFTSATLPFHYDFTINGVRGAISTTNGSPDWFATVGAQINGNTVGVAKLSGFFGQAVVGDLTLTVPNGSPLNSWRIFVGTNSTALGSKNVTIDVPNNSLQLPGGTTQVIPEPVTAALFAGGLAVFGVIRRFRR